MASKLYQPAAPPRWVARPQLAQRLDAGLRAGRALTLISAPAGYGKSTLAAAWLADSPRPVAWLSLEKADDDPLRFFTYFLAALRQAAAAFEPALAATLAAGQLPAADVLVTVLVNGCAAMPAPGLCVLDDFQFIQDPTIYQVLNGLVTHAPPSLHLVLMTREDPMLPLARLRARNQLTEIRAADLRFSEAEAAQFLHEGMGLRLSAGEVARLTERTEGWPAGLQLAGLSLQGRENPGEFVQSLSGSHRYILDYLTEEALKTRPPEVQDFLLKTAILPRLTDDLCDAVTGRSDSAALLEDLLAANLFLIPLDDEGRWYRYHHLFAELLQHRLKRECAAGLPDLHQRASRWHESQDMPAASIEHALAAGDERRVVTLLEKYGWRLLTREHSPMLLKWVQALPEALRNSSPRLNTGLVWGKILHGEYQQAAPYLAAAQTALENLPPDTAESRALHAEILALQSFMAQVQGQAPAALSLAEKARALAPAENMRLVGSTALALGVAYRVAGRFDEAVALLEEALRAAQTIDDQVTAMVAVAHLSLLWYPLGRLRRLAEKAEFAIERTETIAQVAPLMIGAVHVVLGQVYYEWNQVDKARELLLHGLRLAQLSGQSISVIYVNIHLARLCQGTGDLEAAAGYLREAGDALAQGAPAWVHPDWLAQQVSLLLAQGNLTEAEAMLSATGIPAQAPVTYRTDVLHLAWLRWMIASRHPGAFALAERIVQSAESQGRNGTLIYALVLGARAGGGADWLARARRLAAPEGYQRVFIDEVGAPKPVVAPDLIEQLSERELEVLRLLAEGLSYAQMAERLVVSVNTVRHHIKSVYGKLGVNKQLQAVERGRGLGLL